MFNKKWDERFLDLANHVSGWSKDESTQVGAVIVDPKRRIVSIGFNGLPHGIKDEIEILNNRDLKLKTIIHAEINAILFSERSLEGCCLYTFPLPSCSNCATIVIQKEIKRVVFPNIDIPDRWKENMELSMKLFREAGVEVVSY